MEFQFHYGTIKSFGKSCSVLHVVYFNSTMVRLKGVGDSVLSMPLSYFNSTMVRLKVNTDPLLCQSFLFQFHYGTIKSLTPIILM